uniref:Uncharacterized protein n=1 Tax=Amphimedon queenslandica TaxID=400682 RepID=A0A1X7VJI6_AMPQE
MATLLESPGLLIKDCFFSVSTVNKGEFMASINSSFGSGGMICTLSDLDLGNFVIQKVTEFMMRPNCTILASVSNIGGLNSDPPVWILNSDLHLNDCGLEIDAKRRLYYINISQIEKG